MPSIYIHLPWCESKCPYCDFNSHQINAQVSEKRYVDCLLSDLDQDLTKFGCLSFESIFIGGGTPSLFSGKSINHLLNGIRDRVELKDGSEITLEANPGSADAGRFEDYIEAGVNRISIGVQSFNNQLLKVIGRKHSAEEAENAIRIAKSVGFVNFNIDLMFGLPGAQKGDAILDLEYSIKFDPMHISWYQLTLEEKTAFARKPPNLPPHNDICEEFEVGQSILQRNGFAQYEVSAYARNMMKSVHNMNYWEFGDYLGIGAGAHGKISSGSKIVRTEKISRPESYMRAIELAGESRMESEIDASSMAGEYMLNALRLKDGFSVNDYLVRTYNESLDKQFEQNIELACEKGLLKREGDWVKPTRLGYSFLNDLQVIFI
jgi:oxygen-independent coproporphyrinogen-3 oxidase